MLYAGPIRFCLCLNDIEGELNSVIFVIVCYGVYCYSIVFYIYEYVFLL